MEGGGIQIKNMLINKDPFPIEVCEKKKCVLCKTDSKKLKIPCTTNNVGYRLICETWEDKGTLKVYEGETAHSARTRGRNTWVNSKMAGGTVLCSNTKVMIIKGKKLNSEWK